jgi:transposase-like protein
VPGPTPHYPPEFKKEAVKLYRSSGKSIPKMAEDLVIASESLRSGSGSTRATPESVKSSPPRNEKS